MRKIFVVLALTAVSAGVMAAPAAASHSWSTHHWARTSNPFVLQVGDNVGPAWDSYLATASTKWSRSTVLDTTLVPGGTTGRKCRATPGRIEVCDAAYGKNGWLGLATISITGGHITQGTAKMNDSYFDTATYDSPNERHHVMCQEVGHDFGLDHQSVNNADLDTCMDYAPEPKAANIAPNAHDYDQLDNFIYAHTDSSNTIATSPATGPSMADREGTRPYKSERRDSRHFSILTERFSDGSIRITRYTWATR